MKVSGPPIGIFHHACDSCSLEVDTLLVGVSHGTKNIELVEGKIPVLRQKLGQKGKVKWTFKSGKDKLRGSWIGWVEEKRISKI